MNKNEAKLLLGDDNAIVALAAANPNPVEAIKAALAAANNAPGFVNKMQQSLASIVGDEAIALENGVFVATKTLSRDDGKRLLTHAADFFTCGDGVGNKARWILGNILAIMKDQEMDPSEFMEATELAYNTMATSETTFRFFRTKHYHMPFSHHKEIAYAKDLSDDQKHAIAAFVAEKQLALTTARAIIKLTQQQIRDNAEIRSPEDLYEKIDIPSRAGKRFLVIAGAVNRIVDRVPDGPEMEEADEVYEIRSIVKSRVVGGGADNPEQPPGQDVVAAGAGFATQG